MSGGSSTPRGITGALTKVNCCLNVACAAGMGALAFV